MIDWIPTKYTRGENSKTAAKKWNIKKYLII